MLSIKKDKKGSPGELQAGLPDFSLQEDYEEKSSWKSFTSKLRTKIRLGTAGMDLPSVSRV